MKTGTGRSAFIYYLSAFVVVAAAVFMLPLTSSSSANAAELTTDRHAEEAHFRALREAGEDGQVNPDGLYRAIQQRSSLMKTQNNLQQTAISGVPAWSSIGPNNIGGRIRTVVVHPTDANKMWIGSVGGGIWASSNGGSSWSAVNDSMANLAISTMIIDPSNPNIMYAGTGEGFYNVDALRGYGVFKSTDGGATWSLLTSTTPNSATANAWYYVNRLAISSNGVILAATNGGIYRSTDGGSTWSIVYTTSRIVYDVKFDPNNPGNAIASSNDGTTPFILRSTNSGQTWTQTLNITTNVDWLCRIELAYAASASGTLYASIGRTNNDGEVWKSTDGGTAWNQVSTPNHLDGQGWYDNAIWVSPADANFVLIGGIDLYRSTNGGSTFTKISQWYSWPNSAHADQHAIVGMPGFNGTSNKTVLFGNDGGLWKATDVTTVATTSGWTNMNLNGLG